MARYPFVHPYAFFLWNFFYKIHSTNILCPCCTFSLLYSFHVSLFPLVSSSCTLFMLNFFVLHSFSVGLSSWSTASMFPFFCITPFLFYFFHFLCFLRVSRFPCFTFLSCFIFMLFSFHIAIFPCSTPFMFCYFLVDFFCVALFLFCTIFILHPFYYVTRYSYYSFSVLHYFHVVFLWCTLFILHFFVFHSLHAVLSCVKFSQSRFLF